MSLGIRVIKDPEVAKLLADETRRHILHFLRHHEMSASDLAKALKKNHSSIVYHLNALMKAGLIEETRTEKVRNMVQPFYKSVAHRFHVSYSLSEALAENEGFIAWKEEIEQRTLEGLGSFGYGYHEERRDEVKELLVKINRQQRKAFEETVEQQDNPKELGKHVYHNLIKLLTNLKLSQDPEYTEAMDALSAIIEPEDKVSQ
ncbi:MAG: ArsR family transcriptional regulator [Candidatus Bathyarchaeota archaeon]